MSDFNRWSEFNEGEIKSILGALLVCYATSEPKHSRDKALRGELTLELRAREAEESGAVLTINGVPVQRLREQARAEDETYEHRIARTEQAA